MIAATAIHSPENPVRHHAKSHEDFIPLIPSSIVMLASYFAIYPPPIAKKPQRKQSRPPSSLLSGSRLAGRMPPVISRRGLPRTQFCTPEVAGESARQSTATT